MGMEHQKGGLPSGGTRACVAVLIREAASQCGQATRSHHAGPLFSSDACAPSDRQVLWVELFPFERWFIEALIPGL